VQQLSLAEPQTEKTEFARTRQLGGSSEQAPAKQNGAMPPQVVVVCHSPLMHV
jgi:hypothetical protein